MYKILIVEDDTTIADVVRGELEGWGYQALVATEFADIMPTFRAFCPQLVLLDLSLPHRSGLYWCSKIRAESSVPVVFLSSHSDNMNLVTAMHLGADDFIPKPFDLQVLVAKVQAILRRSYDFAAATDTLVHRGAVLHPGQALLTVDGKRVELTRNELRILQMLLERKGRVVSREDLMRRLWEHESFIDDNTLTVNITRLRKKLDDAGLADFIRTKKGLGYLVPEQAP